ncbi:MAG: rRNA maturation RNase YbeY, partial [Bacteroidota bacterium]
LAFVDNREIRKINRTFLKHDFATDVLSFLLGDGNLLGEVVISTEYAAREAKRHGLAVEEELLRYVAHGTLHLLGYDDVTAAKKKVMWSKQEGYLGKIHRTR